MGCAAPLVKLSDGKAKSSLKAGSIALPSACVPTVRREAVRTGFGGFSM